MTAWWYWLLFAVSLAILAGVARDCYLISKWGRRRDRLTAERREQLLEGLFWRAYGESERQHAEELNAQRLARLLADNPAALETAVRLAKVDSRGADLLIAQVTA